MGIFRCTAVQAPPLAADTDKPLLLAASACKLQLEEGFQAIQTLLEENTGSKLGNLKTELLLTRADKFGLDPTSPMLQQIVHAAPTQNFEVRFLPVVCEERVKRWLTRSRSCYQGILLLWGHPGALGQEQ